MLTAILTKVLYGAGAAGVAWLGKKIGGLFGAKAAATAQRAALDLLEDGVRIAVESVEQELRNIPVIGGGKIPGTDCKREAVGRVVSLLGTRANSVRSALGLTRSQLLDAIAQRVESEVLRQKAAVALAVK
jgi:hypothetical protein